ncbi:hypothetical protein [Halalkalibacterium halodurans]|uniref:hypothetical protein n=1 Tax=Halalkalibacterium halodurans TaxID=86665 RepID=UPI002AA9D86E|nr:hypothetical protein [Halalkalibacterium halodurans]MDY7222113.1 hypothetical protein [Halalkalibacterium halodurans]MDY7243868.1 hypothetical protein [Halalkalibacterium halodurans]
MKQIETFEQRQTALKWMVKTAEELSHPLLPAEDRDYKMAVYDYVSGQVAQYNKKLYAGSEYPPLDTEPAPQKLYKD